MISYLNIEQKSEQWFNMKWGKIGGTLSKGLFVKSDTLLIDILSQRCETYVHTEEGFQSDAMRRGNDLEPLARVYLADYLGVEFIESGWLQSEDNELLGMSPDGVTSDYTEQCEIKCLGTKKHYEILITDEIPLEHIHQCLHAFTVNPMLKKLHFLAYRPESPKPFIKTLTLESEINLGTKAKPKVMTVLEASVTAMQLADELLEKIIETEASIQF